MDVDAGEVVTRKLGPLPTWGWALAILGAVVVFKLLGGKSPGTSVGQGGATGGVGVTDMSGSGGPAFEGPSSLVTQLQGQAAEQGTALGTLQKTVTGQQANLEGQTGLITSLQTALTGAQDINAGQTSLISQLQTQAGSLTNFQGIQSKLIGALNTRSSLLSTRSSLQNSINTYRDALSRCRTASCRTKNNKLIKAAQAKQKANTTTLSALDKSIAELQKQLAG